MSALDLSIRAQVMNLFFSLQRELGVACLVVAHDLALVRQAASRVYVMYLGRIVETGSSADIYERPSHPYTRALLASVPTADPRVERDRPAPPILGDIPSPTSPPSGCRFRTRCPIAMPACSESVPPMAAISQGHVAACLRANQNA